jgi:hypothetical protein
MNINHTLPREWEPNVEVFRNNNNHSNILNTSSNTSSNTTLFTKTLFTRMLLLKQQYPSQLAYTGNVRHCVSSSSSSSPSFRELSTDCEFEYILYPDIRLTDDVITRLSISKKKYLISTLVSLCRSMYDLQLYHGDLQNHNIILYGKEIVLIDWERSGLVNVNNPNDVFSLCIDMYEMLQIISQLKKGTEKSKDLSYSSSLSSPFETLKSQYYRIKQLEEDYINNDYTIDFYTLQPILNDIVKVLHGNKQYINVYSVSDYYILLKETFPYLERNMIMDMKWNPNTLRGSGKSKSKLKIKSRKKKETHLLKKTKRKGKGKGKSKMKKKVFKYFKRNKLF